MKDVTVKPIEITNVASSLDHGPVIFSLLTISGLKIGVFKSISEVFDILGEGLHTVQYSTSGDA